jgi:hypothetical protein
LRKEKILNEEGSSSEGIIKNEVKEDEIIKNKINKEEKLRSKTRSEKKEEKIKKRLFEVSEFNEEDDEDKTNMPIEQEKLFDDMKEEHNLKFKNGILSDLRADENIKVFIIFC